LRHNSRLHHVGVGRRGSGTKVLILARDLQLRIITQDDGELIRELTRDYQAQAPEGVNYDPRQQRTVSRDNKWWS
jgi:hypothetical protein